MMKDLTLIASFIDNYKEEISNQKWAGSIFKVGGRLTLFLGETKCALAMCTGGSLSKMAGALLCTCEQQLLGRQLTFLHCQFTL